MKGEQDLPSSYKTETTKEKDQKLSVNDNMLRKYNEYMHGFVKRKFGDWGIFYPAIKKWVESRTWKTAKRPQWQTVEGASFIIENMGATVGRGKKIPTKANELRIFFGSSHNAQLFYRENTNSEEILRIDDATPDQVIIHSLDNEEIQVWICKRTTRFRDYCRYEADHPDKEGWQSDTETKDSYCFP